MAVVYKPSDLQKAAQRGEPSYVWRAGQERRLAMIREHGAENVRGKLLVNGCGVGEYLARLATDAELAVGLDIELPRLLNAKKSNAHLVCAAGEHLPFRSKEFTAVLSNEVIEHVEDDRLAIKESSRSLKTGGVFILFCPNRGYPFETHGVYWRGRYYFGNKLFVNYLPCGLRDRLAPHVRVYSRRDLHKLFNGLPLIAELKTTIFGAYDNIIEKSSFIGKVLRAILQFLEATPLKRLGLSHFWVLRKE
ncbi:MAG: class I SAM-dependent methyltransferase [Pelolinea sp.]|nr:class I SAM-dependent methyltransferase [Pelolinea sp.]